MLRLVAVSLMAFAADAFNDKFSIQMSRFNGFPVEEVSARFHAVMFERQLQDETYCGIFESQIEEFDDDTLGGLVCDCTESATGFALSCTTEGICIKHTTGAMTSYSGDISLAFSGDFSDVQNPVLSDSLCFKYDGGTEACLNDSFVTDNCTVTDDGIPCESCVICNADDGSVSFTCGSVTADQCAGSTLEGTPLQFYGSDTDICDVAETATDGTTDTSGGATGETTTGETTPPPGGTSAVTSAGNAFAGFGALFIMTIAAAFM
jgi:hypothetical protein